MTIPVKTSNPVKADPATVGVALGDRAYDIVIGRDVLPSLGHRIATLRPGARVALRDPRDDPERVWLLSPIARLPNTG